MSRLHSKSVSVPENQRVWTDTDREKIDKHVDFMREQKRCLREFITRHYTKDFEFVTTLVTAAGGVSADCIDVGVAVDDMDFMRDLLKSKPETVVVQTAVRRKTELDMLELNAERIRR